MCFSVHKKHSKNKHINYRKEIFDKDRSPHKHTKKYKSVIAPNLLHFYNYRHFNLEKIEKSTYKREANKITKLPFIPSIAPLTTCWAATSNT